MQAHEQHHVHSKLFLKIAKTITGSCTIVSNRTPTWREDASLKSHELEKYYHGTTFRSAVNKNSKNHENSNNVFPKAFSIKRVKRKLKISFPELFNLLEIVFENQCLVFTILVCVLLEKSDLICFDEKSSQTVL